MTTNSKILELLLNTAAEMNPALPNPIDLSLGVDAKLFGSDGAMDSMGLVQFIVEVEARVEDELGTTIVLASERAMSQRRSPFLSIGSLAAYIEELLLEAQ